MANQPEVVQFDAGIYQIETVDPVDGGVGSKTNAPLLGLANRTAWLKKHVDDLESGALVPEGLAPKNSPDFTGTPTAPTQAVGDTSTKLANDAFVNRAVSGVIGVNVAGAVNVTLTQAQYGYPIILLTGAITANIAVVFPSQAGKWLVVNATTGAFTVTCKTAAGGGTVVTSGRSSKVWCDGSNIQLQQTDFISPALLGTPTTPTAAPGTNTTQIASTEFVQNGLAGRVQNGGGVGQLSNAIKIGWSGAKIKATVDATDMGNLALESFVKNRGVEFSTYNVLTATAVLNNTHVGAINAINNSGGQTFYLPVTNTVPQGATITIYNVSGQTTSCVIARQGTVDTFWGLFAGNQTSGHTSLTIRGGDSVTFTSIGGTVWVVSSGQMASFIDSTFAYQRSLGANGWQKLPGGTIIQWGGGLTDGAGRVLLNFPTAFPNACLGFVVSPRWNDPAYALNCGTNSRSNTQAWVYSNYAGSPIQIGFDWMATGY